MDDDRPARQGRRVQAGDGYAPPTAELASASASAGSRSRPSTRSTDGSGSGVSPSPAGSVGSPRPTALAQREAAQVARCRGVLGGSCRARRDQTRDGSTPRCWIPAMTASDRDAVAAETTPGPRRRPRSRRAAAGTDRSGRSTAHRSSRAGHGPRRCRLAGLRSARPGQVVEQVPGQQQHGATLTRTANHYEWHDVLLRFAWPHSGLDSSSTHAGSRYRLDRHAPAGLGSGRTRQHRHWHVRGLMRHGMTPLRSRLLHRKRLLRKEVSARKARDILWPTPRSSSSSYWPSVVSGRSGCSVTS